MEVKSRLLVVASALALALFLCSSSHAQTPVERHERIHSAVESGDLPAAIRELRGLRNTDPDRFGANNYDYLLARLSEQVGDAAESQISYQAVVEHKSILAPYALWHLAQMARSTGDLIREREYLRRFIVVAPISELRQAAILRLGKSFWESEDDSGVVAALRPLTESIKSSKGREALTLTAKALLRSGKNGEARSQFQRILMEMPDASRPDDFALAAVQGLDSIDSAAPNKTPIDSADHLLRASVYQFNRAFDEARNHYLIVAEQNTQDPLAANALYQIGRGYYVQVKYDEALKYFQKVVDQFPNSASARDAVSFTGASYSRMHRTDDALVAYKLFLQRFPDAPNPERTYLNIIDCLHEAGRYQEALSWVQETRNRFPNQIGATLALFAQARIHLAQQSWALAVSDLNELKKSSDLGSRLPDGTSSAETTFLKAFALEQLNRTREAVDLYLSIPDGRNEYYGQRATARLQELASAANTRELIRSREQTLRNEAKSSLDKGKAEDARQLAQSALRLAPRTDTNESVEILRSAYASLPAYTLPAVTGAPIGGRDFITGTDGRSETNLQAIADELLFLQLYDEALPAVSESQAVQTNGVVKSTINKSSASSFSDRDFTIARLSLRAGHADDAIRFGERLWKSVPADYVLALAPRELVELLYPAPYRESLLKHTSSRGIDPRFVLSIARQESRFQTRAKSAAAARGMMQFISATAEEMARQLDKSGFQQEELYDPDTALLFGAQYLGSLFKELSGQPEAVAAAYNSGADNVARWIGRSSSNQPDRYVAEIGFAQTKDYVFRVMTNFHNYQELYDATLQRH